jgi:heterodisulfide reductase subunit C
VIEFDVWDKDSIGKDDYRTLHKLLATNNGQQPISSSDMAKKTKNFALTVGFASIDIGKVLEHNKKLSQKFELPLRPRPETKKKTAEKIKGVLFVTLIFPDIVCISPTILHIYNFISNIFPFSS